jgi:hypothetical protein
MYTAAAAAAVLSLVTNTAITAADHTLICSDHFAVRMGRRHEKTLENSMAA